MSYFDVALEPKKLRSIAKDAKKVFDAIGIKVENVVGRGTSGIIALPIFAEVFGAAINIVRKHDTSSHSPNIIESIHYKPLQNWVIIDDFVSSGNTVKKIAEAVDSFHKDNRALEGCDSNEPVGMIFYDGNCFCYESEIPNLGFMSNGKIISRNIDTSIIQAVVPKRYES